MSWIDRLKTGLTRSTTRLGDSLAGLATDALPLDDERLDAIEEALIAADLGPAVAGRIRARLADVKFAKGIDEAGLKAAVAAEVTAVLAPVAKPLTVTAFPRPHVILVVGVNGSGKTTTIA
jgi:fused signal recognition particle receptor